MKRTLLILLALLAVVFCSALAAQADSVTVAQTGGTSSTNLITDPQGSNAKETITNTDLFYTDVTLGDFKPKNDGSVEFKMSWDILNQTGFTWLDYQFSIVAEPGFTYKGNIYPISVSFADPASSAAFKGKTPDPTSGTSLLFSYGPPGSKLVKDGETLHAEFDILMTGFPQPNKGDKFEYTFTLEQHDSVLVPLPGAVLLLGAGMFRLVAYARKRREE